MGSPVTWARYFLTKIKVSLAQSIRSYELGNIKEREIYDSIVKNVVQGRLTFKRLFKGTEMTPTFASHGETLLIRSLPRPSPRSVFVGDVVMLEDPDNPQRELVRRVAALEGEEMLSSNDNEEGFKLQPGTCWVLCDNGGISPKEAVDSRSFGPLPLSNIIGRAIYCSRSPVEHGFVQNRLMFLTNEGAKAGLLTQTFFSTLQSSSSLFTIPELDLLYTFFTFVSSSWGSNKYLEIAAKALGNPKRLHCYIC